MSVLAIAHGSPRANGFAQSSGGRVLVHLAVIQMTDRRRLSWRV